MSKFLDQTGLSHFWSKIKTLLAGKADKEELNGINELVNDFNTDIAELYNTKADKTYVDNACDGVYNMVSGELAGKANTIHTHYHNQINPPISSVNTSYAGGSYISSIRACRTFGLPADQIIIEQSIDGGATWTDAGIKDDDKKRMFIQSRDKAIFIPLKNGVRSTDCMLRITITAMKYNVPEGTAETEKYNYWNSNYVLAQERYCSLDFGYFWLCAMNDRISIEHQIATGNNPNTWISDGILQYAAGWSGGNYVKFNGNVFGGNTSQTGNNWNHRFIFRTAASDGSYDDSKLSTKDTTNKQYIHEISCYGSNCWIAANEMMKNDRAYTVDASNQTKFSGTVISTKGFAIYGASDAANRLLKADGGTLHVDVYANRFATADHTHDGYASSTHTHKTFDDDITMNGDLYVENISVNSEIDASRIIENGDYLANRYAAKTHTHDDYVTTTYLNSMRYVSEQDLSTQIQNTEGLIQDLDERVQVLEQASDSASSASCQFKIMTRKTLTTNGGVNLSTYINNSSVSELMIIVRAQTTAAVTLGISNVSTASSSGFIASKSLGTGTSYTKIILSKTDEGYYMWDVNGSIGFSNDPSYVYLRNYSATSGSVTSMTAVIHYR